MERGRRVGGYSWAFSVVCHGTVTLGSEGMFGRPVGENHTLGREPLLKDSDLFSGYYQRTDTPTQNPVLVHWI